jgi:hypothetical protein
LQSFAAAMKQPTTFAANDPTPSDAGPDRSDDLYSVLCRLSALEDVADHRAATAATREDAFDAAQSALALTSIREALVELHRVAYSGSESIVAEYARARYAVVVRDVDMMFPDGPAPRSEPISLVTRTVERERVLAKGSSKLEHGLFHAQRAAFTIERSMMWLRSHLRDLPRE